MEKVLDFVGEYNLNKSIYNEFADKINYILNTDADRIIFDFHEYKWFHASLTSVLGGMISICNKNNKNVILDIASGSAVADFFNRAGLFSEHFNYKPLENKNAIRVKELDLNDEEYINSYIDNILKLAPVTLTEKCRQIIYSAIYEIFDNAEEHSKAKYGIHTGGYWFPKKQIMSFSVYDTGIGIPTSIIHNVDSKMNSKEAFLWALKRGNSTRQLENGIPRGIGLTNLTNFIDLNGGVMTIISNDIMYVRKNRTNKIEIKNNTLGTMINITINADYNHIYTYGKEDLI